MTSPFREEWFYPSTNCCSLASSQFGCSGEGEVVPWRIPHMRNPGREDQSKATSLPTSCQATSPVSIRQSCCHQSYPHKGSLPLEQRGRKVPASPTFQHLMRKGECLATISLLCLKYYMEVKPLTQLWPSPWTPVHKRSRKSGGGNLWKLHVPLCPKERARNGFKYFQSPPLSFLLFPSPPL